jgi:hypothetical protein
MDARLQKRYDDAISKWAAQLIREAEESLAKHAEFDRLYPEPEQATLASDRS